MTSVLLVFQLGQPRIFMAMARDGLLPKVFGQLHPKFRTPVLPTVLTGVLVAIAAMFVDISAAAELTNIGTLAAFIIVCAGVIVLRRTKAEQPRPVPLPYGATGADVGHNQLFDPDAEPAAHNLDQVLCLDGYRYNDIFYVRIQKRG